MASGVANAQDWLARGFRAVAYSGDLWIYEQALAQGIAAVRDAAAVGQNTPARA